MISDFYRYLIFPFFTQEREDLRARQAIGIAKLLFVVFLIAIAGSLLASGIYAANGLERPVNQLSDRSWNMTLLLVACVIAPFVEELIFRSWMGSRFGLIYLFPAFMLIWWLLFARVFELTPGSGSLVVWAVISIIYVSYFHMGVAEKDTKTQAAFPILFWTSSIGFALIHLGNYPTESMGVLSGLLVVPQLISGAAFGYIRMRFGFVATVLSHSSWNTVLLSLLALG